MTGSDESPPDLATKTEPTLNLADLERLARAATPGPWTSKAEPGEPDISHLVFDYHFNWVADCGVPSNEAADAAFIAAANPSAVLALIERLRRAESELSRLKPVMVEAYRWALGGNVHEWQALDDAIDKHRIDGYLGDPNYVYPDSLGLREFGLSFVKETCLDCGAEHPHHCPVGEP